MADWDDLRTLLAVAQTGSLSRAAETLGTTQPTVGRRLDRLEADLGHAVVRRTTQGCTPTEQGAALIPHIARMAAAADEVDGLTQSRINDVSGVVRVAAGPLLARHIAQYLPQILEGAPALRLQVVSGLGAVNLNRGDADLAFRTEVPSGEDWVVRAMPPTPYAAYASQSFADAHPVCHTEDRWSSCPFVGFEQRTVPPSARWMRARGIPIAYGFSSSLVIVEAMASGIGLGLLPLFAGDGDPRLVRVSPPLDDLVIQGHLVIHPSARRLRRVRWVASRIAGLLGG